MEEKESKKDPSQKQSEQEKQQDFDADVLTLVSWSAAGRPFRKRTKQYYLSAFLITALLEIILFLFAQYTLMLAVAALAFLAFTLSFVPPRNFHYKISTEGITVEDHFYIWDELYDFYFKKVEGQQVLHIRTRDFIPGELKISLGDLDPSYLRKILVQFLPYREVVRKTFMEKAGEWLERNFPLEKT